MDLDCGGKCMKVLLFIFNGLFFLAGAAMLGIGIWLMVDPNISSRFQLIAIGTDGLFKAASISMIVVGCLVFIIGFFGCCGAIKENVCMLCTFVVFLSIIFILEITVAILAAVFRKELGEGLLKEMTKQAVKDVAPLEKHADNNATSLAWHSMQYDFFCCGGKNYLDYRNNSHFKNIQPPKTCCKPKAGLSGRFKPTEFEPEDYDTCKAEYVSGTVSEHQQLAMEGCYQGLIGWLRHKSGILIGVVIGIAVVQILGIVFACCLRNQLSRKKEYV